MWIHVICGHVSNNDHFQWLLLFFFPFVIKRRISVRSRPFLFRFWLTSIRITVTTLIFTLKSREIFPRPLLTWLASRCTKRLCLLSPTSGFTTLLHPQKIVSNNSSGARSFIIFTVVSVLSNYQSHISDFQYFGKLFLNLEVYSAVSRYLKFEDKSPNSRSCCTFLVFRIAFWKRR